MWMSSSASSNCEAVLGHALAHPLQAGVDLRQLVRRRGRRSPRRPRACAATGRCRRAPAASRTSSERLRRQKRGSGSLRKRAMERAIMPVSAAGRGPPPAPGRRGPPGPRSSPGRRAAPASARRRLRRPGTGPRGSRARAGAGRGGCRAGRPCWRCRARPGGRSSRRGRPRRRGGRRRRTSCAAPAPRPAIGASTPSTPARPLLVERGDRGAARQQRVELLDLGDAERRGEVGEAVVEAEPVVVEPAHVGGAALVALAAQARRGARRRRGRSSRPRPSSSACWRRRRRSRGCRGRRPARPSESTAPSASQASSRMPRPCAAASASSSGIAAG